MNIKSKLLLRIFTLTLFSFLFISTSTAQSEKLEKIDTYISSSMKDWKMPGFAVAIVKDDSVIFAKGYGTREVGKDEPVDENTLFVCASLSKAFTTATLAMLVDEGKIDWTDKVLTYLPKFQMYDPWVTDEMMIEDLITHRSGLATFSGDMLWLGSNYGRDEVIRRGRYLKPVYSFRSHYGYQNIMFSAAGQIVPAVTDTSWDDFIKYRIFQPLGMDRSNTSISTLTKMQNAAKPHSNENGEVIVWPYYNVDNVAPAAGINSCVKDMAQWIRLQLNRGEYNGKRLFSKQRSNEMWSNHMFVGNGNYGYGWFINYYNGKKIVYHSGGMPGMISYVALVPEENLGMVILSNMDSYLPFAIKNKILDEFTNAEEKKDWSKQYLERWQKRLERYADEFKRRDSLRVENTTPSLALEDYTGTYEDKMYGKADVTMKDGKLYLQFSHSPTFGGELKHWDYDVFTIDWKDPFLTKGWVKFDLDFDGNVKQMSFEVPNSPDFIFTELLFKKLKDKD